MSNLFKRTLLMVLSLWSTAPLGTWTSGPLISATVADRRLPINNFDMILVKHVNVTERQRIEFQAQAINVFNYSQYVPGYIATFGPRALP